MPVVARHASPLTSCVNYQEIPNIVQYLGNAVGTLKDLDPARKDVWARNLTGLGGQYYGRLDVGSPIAYHRRQSHADTANAPVLPHQRVQLTLRKVVRALHERKSSPYAIRPPLPGQPLPAAFEPVVSPLTTLPPTAETQAGDGAAQSASGVTESEGMTAAASKEDGLSVYARRLEAAILQELKHALLEMEHDEQQVKDRRPGEDTKDKIDKDHMDL